MHPVPRRLILDFLVGAALGAGAAAALVAGDAMGLRALVLGAPGGVAAAAALAAGAASGCGVLFAATGLELEAAGGAGPGLPAAWNHRLARRLAGRSNLRRIPCPVRSPSSPEPRRASASSSPAAPPPTAST